MKIIYKNNIKKIGVLANSFLKDKMVILFGNEAPQDLKDFCYMIDIVNIKDKIQAGQKLYIDNKIFEITSVGDIVQRNLETLGHITLRFDGSAIAKLPGTLYLESKEIPNIELNTVIKIVAE